jgi:hypothetical protein
MRDVAWRMGFTLTALAMLAIFGPGVSCSTGNRLVELVSGQTPQARVADFLGFVADGDRQAALELWSPGRAPSDALESRRELVTDALLLYGPHLEYQIQDVVWWRTCCEPAVIDDPDDAGGARVRVTLSGSNHPDATYVFDLLVLGGYWGTARGRPVRHWSLVDVYSEGSEPLVWTQR